MIITFGGIRFRAAAFVLALLGSALPARAGYMIDQQNTVDGSEFTGTPTTSLGQSFTPSLSSINFATASLSTDVSAVYALEVVSGAGPGGVVLGTSGPQTLATGGSGAEQSVEFDFATPITLTPGNTYTLELLHISGANTHIYAMYSSSNPYAGGNAYAGNSSFAAADAVFSEGVLTAVPEPSSLAMMGLGGIAGLGFTRARRRRLA